ncbi:MAG TPA: peptidoglycan-binding domain-containing protein [Terriglobales bacterium]|nr:peptidoglycan-binding domain-containing protein [Terriglobales bacterium]
MRTLLQQAVSRRMIAVLAVGGLVLPAAMTASARKQTPAKSTQASSTGGSASNSAASHTKRSTKGKKVSSRKKKVRGQAAPTPDRVSEIQSALAKKGVYSGEPTGKWDDSTTDAMKKFQSTHGLTPTGKFDALTLQKLGLGSDTAGLGAPTPPPNASANRLLSPKVQRDDAKNEPE